MAWNPGGPQVAAAGRGPERQAPPGAHATPALASHGPSPEGPVPPGGEQLPPAPISPVSPGAPLPPPASVSPGAPLGPLRGGYPPPEQAHQLQGGAQSLYGSPSPPGRGPAHPESLGPTSLGMEASHAAGLSYLGWWLTGVLIYFGERQNRYVRFHAFQSILYTGALTIAGVLSYVVASLLTDASTALHHHSLETLSRGVALLTFFGILFAWWVPLIAAWCGYTLRIPFIGAYAERYAAPPETETDTPSVR
jgi:uncharacterized membrane protein